MSQEGGTRDTGRYKSSKIWIRGSFSSTHRLSDYIKSMVKIAFWQSLSNSRYAGIRLSGIIECGCQVDIRQEEKPQAHFQQGIFRGLSIWSLA